jgi:hypothetical protein
MKHEWNDALATFDRELPLLKALRAEYDAYLRERYDLAIARVGQEFAGRASIAATQEEGEWGLGFELAGALADAALDFRLWPASGYGGENGRLRWGVYLKRQLGEGFPPVAAVLARARATSAALSTEAIASAPADVLDAGDAECVRWGSLDIGAADLVDQLTARLRAALSAMETAAEAVVALRVTTPRSWLEAILRGLKADGSFTTAGATDVRFGSWSPGMTVNVRVSPTDYAWFTPCNDGRLAFHWEPPPAEKSSRRAAVLAGIGPLPAFDQNKWHGVVLLSATDVAKRQADGDNVGVRTLILDTWRMYREACVSPL